MLRPSYTDLLEVFNRDTDDITLGSRYTIVIAAAKRARQLVDHAEPLVDGVKVDKPVSIAVNELYHGKIKVREGHPEAIEGEIAEDALEGFEETDEREDGLEIEAGADEEFLAEEGPE